MGFLHNRALVLNGKSYLNMLEQPKAGLISRFFRQVENRLKNHDMDYLILKICQILENLAGIELFIKYKR